MASGWKEVSRVKSDPTHFLLRSRLFWPTNGIQSGRRWIKPVSLYLMGYRKNLRPVAFGRTCLLSIEMTKKKQIPYFVSYHRIDTAQEVNWHCDLSDVELDAVRFIYFNDTIKCCCLFGSRHPWRENSAKNHDFWTLFSRCARKKRRNISNRWLYVPGIYDVFGVRPRQYTAMPGKRALQ